MRIGMILDKTFPPDSRVENEAISLIEAGHEVYLFCLQYGGQPTNESINGINVCRYKSNKLEYKLSALAYTISAYHKLLRPKIADFIAKNEVEVIHIHDMAIAEAVFNANEKFNLPVVLDLHENRPEIMRHYGHVKSWKGKLLINPDKWAKKQNEFVRKAEKIVVVTEEAKEQLLREVKRNSTDVVVVPNTVHPDIYLNYEIDQKIIDKYKDEFTLMYLGDTGLRRGTDTALKALAIIKDDLPNVKLVMVGKNDAEDHILKQLATDLGVKNYVDFEGWQDVSLFPSYVMAADVCLSPLKRNLHHDTTFANKLFQYMAMGKPVVVSNSTAQANVVKEEKCGLIHEAEKEEDLAEKISYLYKNNEEARLMGTAGKQAVLEKWNWKISSYGLIKMYDELKTTS